MSIALLSLAFLPMDLIVFDDGEGQTLFNQSIVQPQDDILVTGTFAPTFLTTTVWIRSNVELNGLTLERRGTVRMFEDSLAHGSAVVEPQGQLLVLDRSSILGDVHVAGGFALLATTGTVGAVQSDVGSDLRIAGETLIEGNLTIDGEATIAGGSIAGVTSISSTLTYPLFASNFQDGVSIEGGAVTKFGDSTFASTIDLRGSSTAEFFEGNSFGGVLQLADTSTATFHLRTANVLGGDVTAASGVIVGTDLDGRPMSFSFHREPGARLTIAIDDTPLGESFCDQTRPNSTGQVGRVRASGSLAVADDQFVLTATAIPTNAFGFFFVGTTEGNFINTEGYRVCVGGNIGRFVGPGQVTNSGAAGILQLNVPLVAMPGNPSTPVVPGSTFVFQLWHRDSDAGMSTHPLTNAISATFE